MIQYESEYRRFLEKHGLQDVSVKCYVYRLKDIAEKTGKKISPRLFKGDFSPDGFLAAWAKIEPCIQHYTRDRISRRKSNFKWYWKMLCANRKLR